MRDILNLLENLVDEAKSGLSAGVITKYPNRFDAFITHIRDGQPFYTVDGDEVIVAPAEAERFLALNQERKFTGAISAKDVNGRMWPVSKFLKTAEFGGQAAKPTDDKTQVGKETAQLKPTQIGITDKPIQAGQLGQAIAKNPVLNSTEYGKAVAATATAIVNGQPAVIPKELVANEKVKKAIVDYAGEYLGVLALVNNQSSFPNRDEFLKWLGGSLSNLTLNFPSKSNMQIADSFASIINPTTQHQINISSKGTGGGAPPSLSGLKIPKSVLEKKEYATAVDFINICQDKKLPKPTTISQVYAAMNLLYERVPESIPDAFKPFLPWNVPTMTALVADSVKNETPMPNYSPLFANLKSAGSDGGKLTYVVKDAVLKAVNHGAIPEFQAAVLETLDYNFIQQYTNIVNKTGQLTFTTQWPARLNGIVSLESKSGGTDPTKGGFSFKLRPSGGMEESADMLPVVPAVIKTPKDNIKKYGRPFQR